MNSSLAGYENSRSPAVADTADAVAGLASALKKLFEVADQTLHVAQTIEHSLGLCTPRKSEGTSANTPPPEGPAAQIRAVTDALQIANDKLHDSCRHLNT